VTFENVSYTVNAKLSKEEMAHHQGLSSPWIEKTIVKNASGYALPGQTLFIMGPSGAGKTSLLNILSDRISLKGAKLTGEVKINDKHPLNQETFGGFGSYVMQDDILFSHFTPREALTFAARLRLHA